MPSVVMPVYPDDELPEEPLLSDLRPQDVIREIFERIVAVHPAHKHRAHDIAYQRMCAVIFCISRDPAVVEQMQPAVVAKRLGLSKQAVTETMAGFAKSISMEKDFKRRQRADLAHNASRRLPAHAREPITASGQWAANCLPGLSHLGWGKESFRKAPRR